MQTQPDAPISIEHPIENMFIQQDWASYTPDQHAVWAHLYARRMEQLRPCVSKVYLEGTEIIGLQPNQVPDLKWVNSRLLRQTGWSTIAVSGFIPEHPFFECLAQRRFPTTVTLRTWEQLDYLPEPDIFHDIFGHVPMHANRWFADFLQQYGAVAVSLKSKEDIERMARLFWFTVEFGLIQEDGETKVYGSGVISSGKECAHALSPQCEKRPFDLEEVFEQDFSVSKIQEVLFVIESYSQLSEHTSEAARLLL